MHKAHNISTRGKYRKDNQVTLYKNLFTRFNKLNVYTWYKMFDSLLPLNLPKTTKNPLNTARFFLIIFIYLSVFLWCRHGSSLLELGLSFDPYVSIT